MLQFLAIIKLVIQLLPVITELVGQAEALFPQAGSGAHKLAVVRGALETAYNTGSTAEATFEEVWPTVNNVVTNIVAGAKAIKAAGSQEAP